MLQKCYKKFKNSLSDRLILDIKGVIVNTYIGRFFKIYFLEKN